MKFLIDENLPPRLADWLRARGHDAVHVGQSLGFGCGDQSVAAFAESEGRIIVTKDADSDAPRGNERTLHLRIGNCSTTDLFAWLEPQLEAALLKLAANELYVALD